MKNAFTQKWDLTSIPDPLLNKEHARRMAAKRVYTRKMVTCDRCARTVSATDLRYRCPEHLSPAARGVPPIVRRKKKEVP